MNKEENEEGEEGNEKISTGNNQNKFGERIEGKRSWSCSSVEMIYSGIPQEEYNQLLEELGEIVYRHFCQLSENQLLAPETTAFAERTGS